MSAYRSFSLKPYINEGVLSTSVAFSGKSAAGALPSGAGLAIREEPLNQEPLQKEPLNQEILQQNASNGSLKLSSWRGRSGHRYIVSIHDILEPDLENSTNAVLLAVRRHGGRATLVGAVMAGETAEPSIRLLWLKAMQGKGADELHIHRLAPTLSARRFMAKDIGFYL